MALTIKTVDDQLLMEITDEKSGGVTTASMNRYNGFAVLTAMTKCLNDLPADPTQPIAGQQAVLKSIEPSFQVGITDDGNIMLALRPDPIPPMEFEFTHASVDKLIKDLQKAVQIPHTPKGRPN